MVDKEAAFYDMGVCIHKVKLYMGRRCSQAGSSPTHMLEPFHPRCAPYPCSSL